MSPLDYFSGGLYKELLNNEFCYQIQKKEKKRYSQLSFPTRAKMTELGRKRNPLPAIYE